MNPILLIFCITWYAGTFLAIIKVYKLEVMQDNFNFVDMFFMLPFIFIICFVFWIPILFQEND